MAASTITAAQAVLINSLSQEEIPIKLRCAICSRLAVNAFRLPCCDQPICETCQSTLPSTCPVCEHSPVAAEDCKPNKSLRTTIKVFLRTEEKKREALRLKEAKEATPITPVDIAPTPAETLVEPIIEIPAEVKEESPTTQEQLDVAPPNPTDVEQTTEAQQDVLQQSIEEIAPGQEPTLEIDANNPDHGTAVNEDESAQQNTNGELDSTNASCNAFSFGAAAAGGFPGMGMGGDFNQMQMMMAMQNGMGTGGFGNYPMMGMPGMSMDPMVIQNMFINGGFGAGGMMGVNGMNVGMGMGGFDGGVGGGFNNGWNGQQSWNVGPDNFNDPNAAGITGLGDYGASNNSGYTQNASSGFNQQGNYGRPNNQYNDYQNNNYGNNPGYQSRGRGRGRGGYGRGGHGYASQDTYSQQFPQQFGAGQHSNGPISETGSIATAPKAEVGNVDEFGREIRPKSATKEDLNDKVEEDIVGEHNTTAVQGNGTTEGVENGAVKAEAPPQEAQEHQDEGITLPIQSLDEMEDPTSALGGPNGVGYNGKPFGPGRGGYQGQFNGGRGGSFNAMQPPVVKPVDIPINAPKGPKAMRDGLPNIGFRGRGFSIAGRGGPRTNGIVNGSIAPEPETELRERDKTRSPSGDRSRERSKERKRNRSRERHHRKHRHRSESLSEDEKETERRRDRRRERRRRREEEESRDEAGDEVPEEKEEADRFRSASPSEHNRSSHRSRRDKDKYRERERESDREHKSSSHRHRSHRSHRDDRSRSRDRDRERDHRSRHSRRGSLNADEKPDKEVLKTPTEEKQSSRRQSVISNGTSGLEIKGVSSHRKSIEEVIIPTGPRGGRPRDRQKEKEKSKSRHQQGTAPHSSSSRHRESESRPARETKEREREKEKPKIPATSAPPVQDPHTLEREARNRERLLKEAQRMAGLNAGMGGRKRSRDDGDVAGGDRKGRKKGRRGGHVVEDAEEGRIARLEAERESARWD